MWRDPATSTVRDVVPRLTCLILFVASNACGAPQHAESRPNFVFILVDDLGWRDLGAFGSTFYETPNIDSLAADGMRFTNAYAASPVCSPSRASILTGRSPARLGLTDYVGTPGVGKLVGPASLSELPAEELTVAEAFEPAGYTSYFVGKWHLGSERDAPKLHGFDESFQPSLSRILGESTQGLTRELTDRALELLAGADRPFLLFLWYYAVHSPWTASEELIGKYETKARGLRSEEADVYDKQWGRSTQDHPVYAGMLEELDDNIGRLLTRLEELELSRETVVIFTSDNGGASTGPFPGTSNLPLRAGKGWLYEGGIRVPLIVRWPGVIAPGSRSEEPVTGADIFPTMLSAAGLPLQPQRHRDGVNLMPLLTRTGSLDREALYWHYPHYVRGATPGGVVRKGRYKLIEFFEDGHTELYDLQRDIAEREDIAAAEPARRAALEDALASWRREVDAQMPTPNPSYGQAMTGAETRSQGDPVLHRLAASNSPLVLELFLARGADVDARDAKGQTALHYAARSGPQSVELLLAHGAAIDAKSNNGLTPLHIAAQRGQLATATLLMDRGADANGARLEPLEVTPLMAASSRGQLAMVELLLDRGAEIDARDQAGTALHAAARAGEREVAELLLARGADATATDVAAFTAARLAAFQGRDELAALIRRAEVEQRSRGPAHTLRTAR